MIKEFKFQDKSLEELKGTPIKELASLLNSRARRNIKRGFTDAQKAFLKRIRSVNEGKSKKPIRTHCRDMIVLPEMVGLLIQIYNGKSFSSVKILPEMIGHYLGEFALTRQKVQHSAPGIGATKSSAAVSVK